MSITPLVFTSFEGSIKLIAEPWLRGDGLFETIKVEDSQPTLLEAHLERLKSSAQTLHFELPDFSSIATESKRLASLWSEDLGRMRITLLSDAKFIISIEELVDTSRFPVKLGIAIAPIHSQGVLAGHKSLSYGATPVNLRKAMEAGLTDLILLNERGEVVETTIANIFAVFEERIVTPPLASGCLPGIARESLLKMSPTIVEEVLHPEDLLRAKGIFLTSSLRGISQVSLLVTQGATRNFLNDPEIEDLRTRLLASWRS